MAKSQTTNWDPTNMSKKPSKDKKRKQKLREKLAVKNRRGAIVREGDTTRVYVDQSGKGYNVEMIRDFLEHLLLEIRVQHFEGLEALQTLTETNDIEEITKREQPLTATTLEQFVKFQDKYQTALIAATGIDGKGATKDETRRVAKEVLTANCRRREEQIGHLEALQELIDQALMCAKVPFGFDAQGDSVQPTRSYKVRDILDGAESGEIRD